MYGFKILCEISKGTFEISHQIEPIHRKICILLSSFLCSDIFELWRHKP